MIYIRLFWEFFKTGLFAIGGGLATIPFLYDIAKRTGWYTAADISDMIAVSESTPGPMGINMSTYVGFKVAGIPGAVIASLSLVLPSVIIIVIIAGMLKKFRDSKFVNDLLYGIRPASVAMIACAGLLVMRIAMLYTDKIGTAPFLEWFNVKAILLGAVVLVTYLKWKKHPIIYILCAAAAGIVFKI